MSLQNCLAGAMWKLLPSWHISVYTIQPCTMSCYFTQSHICRMHVCLALTCHLHFWQNDWDFSCATVVTWGRNWCWNKSQRRNLTAEETSFATPAGTQTCNLLIVSLPSIQWVRGVRTVHFSPVYCGNKGKKNTSKMITKIQHTLKMFCPTIYIYKDSKVNTIGVTT